MAIANVTTILGAETVPCAAGESVECGFNVSNESAKSVRLSVETRTEGGTQEGWLEVLGDIERELPESGNDQVTVRVNLPNGTPEGKYAFRLRVYATDDPEQFADSPAVAVEVLHGDRLDGRPRSHDLPGPRREDAREAFVSPGGS